MSKFPDDLNLQESPIDISLDECEENQERNEKGDCVYIDACAKGPVIELCGPNANCTSILGKAKCDCLDGFRTNKSTGLCEDVDECKTHEHDCLIWGQTTCKNLIGSHECLCDPGFKKAEPDLHGVEKISDLCVDIKECEDPDVHKCDQFCLELVGGFKCSCYEGYVLQLNRRTCVEENPCYSKSFCDGICEKIDGKTDKSEKTKKSEYACKKCPSGLFIDVNQTDAFQSFVYHFSPFLSDRELYTSYDWPVHNSTCFPIGKCKEPDICLPSETCIDLEDGDPAQCVDLACTEDYTMDPEDGICIKKKSVKDDQPWTIGKRVIRLPVEHLSYFGAYRPNTIYRFKHPNDPDGVEFKIELKIGKQRGKTLQRGAKRKHTVDQTYFRVIGQKPTYSLVLLTPIGREQQFVIEINLVHNEKTLHQYRLFVFVD